MNYETYLNLLCVVEKRKRQASLRGDWATVAKAVAEIERLRAEYESKGGEP